MKQSSLFMFFFVLIFSFQLNGQTALDFYQSAGKKFDAYNFAGAITEYSAAIRLDPTYTNAYFNRGLAHLELENYSAALLDINQVINLTPNDLDVFAQRANIKKMMNDLNGAVADYSIVLDQKRDAAVFSDRGAAYMGLKKFDEAIQDFRESIALDPNTAITWSQMADVFFAKKEYQTAIQHYGAALNINPKLVVALNNRGNAYKASKLFDDAISDYSTAIEITAISDLYANRSIAYSAKHLYSLAIEDSQYALKLDKENPIAYFSLGAAQMEANDLNNALQSFNRTIELDHTYTDAFARRAELKYMMNNFQGAIQDQEKYINSDNNDVAALDDLEKYKFALNGSQNKNESVTFHATTQKPTTQVQTPRVITQTPTTYNIPTTPNNEIMASKGVDKNAALSAQQLYYNGTFAYDNKDYWTAIDAFNDVLDRDPKNYRARNLRGLCYLILKKYNLASRDFDDVAAVKPDFAEAYHNRANLKIKNNKVNQAIRDYTKAINLNPKAPNYFENRGRAYLRTQEFTKAKEDFDQAIILNPKNADYDFLAGYACLQNYHYQLAANYFSIMVKKDPSKSTLYKEYIDKAKGSISGR